MTNDEMIEWCGLGLPSRTIGSADADWNAAKVQNTYNCLDALIWIVKRQAKAEVWAQIAAQARQEHDVQTLQSLPGKLKNKKNPAPQGVDSGS